MELLIFLLLIVLIVALGTIGLGIFLIARFSRALAGVFGISGVGLLAIIAVFWLVAAPSQRNDSDRVDAAPTASPVEEALALHAIEGKSSTEPASAKRPSWVDRPAGRSGGVYHVVVSAGPGVRQIDNERELQAEITDAVNNYLEENHPGASPRIDIPPEYINKHVIQDVYAERRVHSFGPGAEAVDMVTIYALLEFDREADLFIENLHRAAVVASRLWYTGFGTAGVLAGLAALFGLLQLNRKGKR